MNHQNGRVPRFERIATSSKLASSAVLSDATVDRAYIPIQLMQYENGIPLADENPAIALVVDHFTVWGCSDSPVVSWISVLVFCVSCSQCVVSDVVACTVTPCETPRRKRSLMTWIAPLLLRTPNRNAFTRAQSQNTRPTSAPVGSVVGITFKNALQLGAPGSHPGVASTDSRHVYQLRRVAPAASVPK